MEPCDGDVHKMFLGSIVSDWDKKKNSVNKTSSDAWPLGPSYSTSQFSNDPSTSTPKWRQSSTSSIYLAQEPVPFSPTQDSSPNYVISPTAGSSRGIVSTSSQGAENMS